MPTEEVIRPNAALVLEGGALRSVYTGGILDIFMESGLEFPYIIGVSAGALCGLNYLTKQRGRTAQINTNYIDDPRYISLRNRFRGDGVFSVDYLFEEPNGRWAPFDYQLYAQEIRQYIIGATSCTTGLLKQFPKPPREQLLPALKASCAIPIAAKMVEIDGQLYLDGGIADSVPYLAAMQAGYDKIVVVKTQAHGYRKKPDSKATRQMYEVMYSDYPALFAAVNSRPQRYNAQMDEIENLAAAGRLFVIEPEHPVDVARIEKDKEKLRALYADGLKQGKKMLPALMEYLGYSV